MESELDMYKILEELSNLELKLELKERQLNYIGTEEERRERLETWLIENGHDPNFYEFKDRVYIRRKEYMDSFMKSMESIFKCNVSENVTRPNTDHEKLAVTSKGSPIEETPKSTEDTTPAGESALYPIAALVSVETKTEEMVNGSTLGEIKVLLPWSEESGKKLREKLGEEVEAEETLAEEVEAEETLAEVIVDSLVVDVDSPIEEPHMKVESVVNNNELGENLANVNEFTPVSGEPVPCQIASLVSVEKKTEVIIEGEVEPPCVEESVGELDLGDSGERFELEVAEFNSAVDVAEIRAVSSIAAGGDTNSEVLEAEKAKSIPVDRVYEVLTSDEDVDSVTLLNPEFRTEPLGGGAEDPVVATCETVDLRKSSVAEIQIEPHELLVLLFIMFSNFIVMTFGTGSDPATEGSLVHRQSKDSVPRVKMKNRRTMVNSLFGTNRFKEGAML